MIKASEAVLEPITDRIKVARYSLFTEVYLDGQYGGRITKLTPGTIGEKRALNRLILDHNRRNKGPKDYKTIKALK